MPVNLDDVPEDDLDAFVGDYSYKGLRNKTKELFPDMPEGSTQAARLLRMYARKKALAMRSRKGGLIQRAILYEEACQKIYDNLPEFARW